MKCEGYLCTRANQFGFKKAHGTELCIYTLREYVELHRKISNTVFVTFLGASIKPLIDLTTCYYLKNN